MPYLMEEFEEPDAFPESHEYVTGMLSVAGRPATEHPEGPEQEMVETKDAKRLQLPSKENPTSWDMLAHRVTMELCLITMKCLTPSSCG